MLILSVFVFLFGILLTVFGSFKIGQSKVKVVLDDSIKECFSTEVQKFMEKHSTQEKIVLSIDDKIESLFKQKLKEIETAAKTIPTNKKTCDHSYKIVTEGTISQGNRTTGRYYDLQCKYCGSMKRDRFNVDD